MKSAMEPATREAVTSFWAILAFLGNSVAFLIIGFQTNIITLSQSILIIIAAFAAVTMARAATVYPILDSLTNSAIKFQSSGGILLCLVEFRGALSIALAATITTSAVISLGDIQTINTMVLGVAFISIVLQVPLLFRYVGREYLRMFSLPDTEIDEQFELISAHFEKLRKLKSEGKISNEEFTRRIEENKKKLDELIAQSPITVETRKIIRARARALYGSFPKIRLVGKTRIKIKLKKNKSGV